MSEGVLSEEEEDVVNGLRVRSTYMETFPVTWGCYNVRYWSPWFNDALFVPKIWEMQWETGENKLELLLKILPHRDSKA